MVGIYIADSRKPAPIVAGEMTGRQAYATRTDDALS